jgi:regulator of nucleoside diphosphate kinase
MKAADLADRGEARWVSAPESTMKRVAKEALDSMPQARTFERPPIVLKASDRDRLSSLLLTSVTIIDPQAARFLREEIDRAEIVCSEVSSTALVSIGSTVKFIHHDATSTREVTLVPPNEANEIDLISVIGKLGSALIGLGPGQTISWCDDQTERRTTVLATNSKIWPGRSEMGY